jgi:hydroxyacylglutathione hydrolase
VPELVAATGARVEGASADAHRLPPLTRAFAPGDTVAVGGETGAVIDVPGHTVGHVAFHFPASGLAFTADSLMAAGCGRLFEGTAVQMWDSLSRLMALPDSTVIGSGHDYLAGNFRFALAIEPGLPALISRIERTDRLRREGRLPMPSTLAEEKASNPFLRAGDPAMKAALGMEGAPDATVFAELRGRKDRF